MTRDNPATASGTEPPAGAPSRGWLSHRAQAVAAVVGTIVAILSLLLAGYETFLDSDDEPTAAPTPTATLPDASPPGPSTSGLPPTKGPLAPGPPEPPPVRWAGTVRLGSGGVDIDGQPPLKGSDGADIRKDDFTMIDPGSDASLIDWGPSAPGYSECRSHVEPGNTVPLIDVPQDNYFCVLTDQGRVAAVRYLGIGVGGQFGFNITVWEKP